jgi:hypothetical protein
VTTHRLVARRMVRPMQMQPCVNVAHITTPKR